MRRLSVPFGLFVLFSLGCGFLGKTGDDTDTTDTNDVEPLDQSEVCADYLDCVAAADPDSFPDLQDTYGPAGDCWTQGEDVAEDCTTACQAAVEDLARSYPTENGCEDYAPDYALDDGTYAFSLSMEDDGCTLEQFVGNPWSMEGTVSNDIAEAEFTLDLSDGANDVALFCTNDGRDFSCASGEGIDMQASGTASSDHQRAEGDWVVTFGTECSSTGTFTAEME
jgi:hypothetical protein